MSGTVHGVRLEHRSFASLPETDLGWVRMRDHFLLTVGPRSGEGRPYSDLLVLADATFAPHGRFPLHPHRDVEVLSVVLRGELTHFEPGTSVALPEGSVQLMSSGTGIVHAEGNVQDVPVRMLQLWFRPRSPGGTPEHHVSRPGGLDRTLRTVSPASMRQDATVAMARAARGEEVMLRPAAGRALYVLVFDGRARIGTTHLADGDAVLVREGEATLVADDAITVVAIDVRAG